MSSGVISMMPSYGTGSMHHLNEIAAKLYKNSLPRCGVLPPAVRWISRDRLTYLFEQVPHMQRITYIPKAVHKFSSSEEPEELYLPMPWLQYFIRFSGINMIKLHSIQLYARTTPISSMDDVLYKCPLPNMDEDTVCLGKNTITNFIKQYNTFQQVGKHWTIQDALSIAVNCFWEAGFNDDIPCRVDSVPNKEHAKQYPIDGLAWLKYWESLNLEEDVLRWQLQPAYGGTVAEVSSGYEDNTTTDIFDLIRDNRANV